MPRKIQRTQEREFDWLFKIIPGNEYAYLLNIEWQVSNDPDMSRRMLLYDAFAGPIYKLPVRGVVIYIKKKKINMPVEIRYKQEVEKGIEKQQEQMYQDAECMYKYALQQGSRMITAVSPF